MADAPLRISASVGGSAFNPDHQKPIICFVGGVGITPALALCRMLAKNQVTAKIYLDYSASNEEDFFCRDELLQIAQSCRLSVKFRQTASNGRIQQANVDAIVQQHPDEHYYVCGPDSYKTKVIGLLRNCDVTPRQIIDLESSQTEAENSEHEPPAVETKVAWGYRITGSLLLMAYVLQDSLGLKLTTLEQLQNQHNYKITSGLLLLLYVLMQWRLPIVRWLKLANDKLLRDKQRHQYFGAVAPLVFYLHASSIGYAYLLALSSVYLANSLLGYSSGEFIAQTYRKAYLYGWTIMHVGLSTSLLFLSGYHAYIAFSYK